MNIFLIDVKNRVTVRTVIKAGRVPIGECEFRNATELAELVAGWPGARIVEIWNNLPNAEAVRRFTDRKTAVRRIWAAVQELPLPRTPQTNETASSRRRAPAKAGGTREDTKTERIIALLKRPSGATLNDIMAETGWQAHSVRGFISGQLSSRLGFRIKSFKDGGERIYRIVKGESREHTAL